jgi:hypothetical protein
MGGHRKSDRRRDDLCGAIFIAGAWINKGQYVRQTNRWLGILYIVFGLMDANLAHIIAGVVSLIVGLLG